MRDITRPAMALLVAVLATLAGACDRGPAFRIERLPERASGAASLPAAWAAAYRDLLTPSVTVEEVSGPDAAAAAVRDGRARFAVTAAGAAAGLAAFEIDAVPVALIVPLTFRVEDVTADQARALVSGRAAHWRDVGGPPAGVTVGTGERGADAGAAQRPLGWRRRRWPGRQRACPSGSSRGPGAPATGRRCAWTGACRTTKATRLWTGA
ncbi:MAG: hypothetical protein U0531_02495 [Dehalococcoidia bacterium]